MQGTIKLHWYLYGHMRGPSWLAYWGENSPTDGSQMGHPDTKYKLEVCCCCTVTSFTVSLKESRGGKSSQRAELQALPLIISLSRKEEWTKVTIYTNSWAEENNFNDCSGPWKKENYNIGNKGIWGRCIWMSLWKWTQVWRALYYMSMPSRQPPSRLHFFKFFFYKGGTKEPKIQNGMVGYYRLVSVTSHPCSGIMAA